MPTVVKGAAQEVYKALFAALTGDAALRDLLGVEDEIDKRIYQTAVDFDSAAAIKGLRWLTFNLTNDVPAPIEQSLDVRLIRLDIHIWERGPGSDKAEAVEKRVRELLDGQDISTATLLAYSFVSSGYAKTYEAQQSLWHITSSFEGMFAALEAA